MQFPVNQKRKTVMSEIWTRKVGAAVIAALVILSAISGAAIVFTGAAHAQEWPAVYDPFQILTLNLELNPVDWQTVLNDETYDIEVPVWFWTGSEEPIYVSVRRKSGDPISTGGGAPKVSLKIDINEYIEGQKWRSLTKLSLENGDDSDIVREGLAWNVHRLASCEEGYGYEAGFASWMRVIVNGEYIGLYASVEQRNKQFMRNRGLYIKGATWLYKISDMASIQLEFGLPHSPTYEALCYSPFRSSPTCTTPSEGALASQLPDYVNMQGMMTMAAVESFIADPDALFSHTKNAYFADFLGGRTRMYFPWDLDSVFTDATADIYQMRTPYQTIILANSTFRALYDQIMTDLLGGPLSGPSLIDFVNRMESTLSAALAEDPNNQIEDPIPDYFDGLRAWILLRIAHVLGQLGYTCTDGDGDGSFAEGGGCGEVDCDDADPAVYPGRIEDCGNGIDDNCDGLIDGSDPDCTCTDGDGDGYGSPASPACLHPEEDCDDADPAVNPGAYEGPEGDPTCLDGVDNDCDGYIDAGEDPGCTLCWDFDGDGYFDAACGGTDCDDDDPAVNPGVIESVDVGNCVNGKDDDCDGTTDLDDPDCEPQGCYISAVLS